MRLLLDRLSEDPDSFAFDAALEWLEAVSGDPEHGGARVDAAHIELGAHRMGEDVYLAGEVCADLELACGRCLTRYRQRVREPFRLVLEPAGSRVPADPEGAESLARDGLALSDELEAGWFRGSEVCLDGFLQEVVAAGLPWKTLCREDCAGLCPSCGIDRNLASCSCRDEAPASPFLALGGLRERLAGGGSGEGEDR